MAPSIPVGSSARRSAWLTRLTRRLAAGLGLQRLRTGLIRG
ncbi:MAG TPA: hypothetical protein PK306_15600 [Aquabacterium sp.]|nr:hypothetical protein [Aquabacterium sp.]HQC97129.1 hypothetical protein [Aquabacterium sp.]